MCDQKWLLVVPMVIIIIAAETKERHMEVNGQRRMETMLFQHRSPRRQAMFLQHTSMDHAQVQALLNSHTSSDFGFVPIIPRISARSHSLLQAVLHLVILGYSLYNTQPRRCHTKLRMSSICSSQQITSALRPNSATRMPESVLHGDIS